MEVYDVIYVCLFPDSFICQIYGPRYNTQKCKLQTLHFCVLYLGPYI